MAYQKVLVDNITCSRRFHITFDDADASCPDVSLKCLHCGEVIFSQKDHPPARLVRDENLVKTTELSRHRTNHCQFQEKMPPIKPGS